MPHQHRAHPAAQLSRPVEVPKGTAPKGGRNKLRLRSAKLNLHGYEPDFNSVTRALFGRDMDAGSHDSK